MQIEYWVKKVYIYIIFIAVGLMALHNLIILISEIRRRKKKKDNKIQIQRFSRNEVIQHAVMVLSFFGLAITGFALKYPNAWYFDWLPWLRMSENLRQTIHRICAILMMAVSFYHILYIFGTRRGRFALKQLLPKWKDFKDVKKTWDITLTAKKKNQNLVNLIILRKLNTGL